MQRCPPAHYYVTHSLTAAWKLVSSGVKLYNCVQCPAHAVCFSASYRWPPCSLFQCVHTDLSRLITFENMIFMLLRMIICVQNLWKDYTLTLDLFISDFGGKINSFLTWTNLNICTLVRPSQSQTKPPPCLHILPSSFAGLLPVPARRTGWLQRILKSKSNTISGDTRCVLLWLSSLLTQKN